MSKGTPEEDRVFIKLHRELYQARTSQRKSEEALRVAREYLDNLAKIANDADRESWNYWNHGGTPPDSTSASISLGLCRKARQAITKINSILGEDLKDATGTQDDQSPARD